MIVQTTINNQSGLRLYIQYLPLRQGEFKKPLIYEVNPNSNVKIDVSNIKLIATCTVVTTLVTSAYAFCYNNNYCVVVAVILSHRLLSSHTLSWRKIAS